MNRWPNVQPGDVVQFNLDFFDIKDTDALGMEFHLSEWLGTVLASRSGHGAVEWFHRPGDESGKATLVSQDFLVPKIRLYERPL